MPQTNEIQFTDRYGETRRIRRTRTGYQLKNETTTAALALGRAAAPLIGAKIKALRLAAGMTLEELCVSAGLVSNSPKSRMWEIENDVRPQGVSIGTLYALALALHVDIDALMPCPMTVREAAKVSETPIKTSLTVLK